MVAGCPAMAIAGNGSSDGHHWTRSSYSHYWISLDEIQRWPSLATAVASCDGCRWSNVGHRSSDGSGHRWSINNFLIFFFWFFLR
ncbi:hypothetical protein ACOSP7_021136 [Xanthoceras sorbifolium]